MLAVLGSRTGSSKLKAFHHELSFTRCPWQTGKPRPALRRQQSRPHAGPQTPARSGQHRYPGIVSIVPRRRPPAPGL